MSEQTDRFRQLMDGLEKEDLPSPLPHDDFVQVELCAEGFIRQLEEDDGRTYVPAMAVDVLADFIAWVFHC